MNMPGRTFSAGSSYRYGFNGMEKDNSTGEGNLDFGARIYNSRLARWLSLDPLQKKYPNESHYAYVSNSPTIFKDADGRDKILVITIVTKRGNYEITMRDKNYKKVYAKWENHFQSYSGWYYYEADVKVNLTIDARESRFEPERLNKYRNNSGNFDSQKFLTDIPLVQDLNYEVIPKNSLGLLGWAGAFAKSGSEGSGRKFGFKIYGGTRNWGDMSWEDGFPLAEVTEELNLESMFDILGSYSGEKMTELQKFEKLVGHMFGLSKIEKVDDITKLADKLQNISKVFEKAEQSLSSTSEEFDNFLNSSSNLLKQYAPQKVDGGGKIKPKSAWAHLPINTPVHVRGDGKGNNRLVLSDTTLQCCEKRDAKDSIDLKN